MLPHQTLNNGICMDRQFNGNRNECDSQPKCEILVKRYRSHDAGVCASDTVSRSAQIPIDDGIVFLQETIDFWLIIVIRIQIKDSGPSKLPFKGRKERD